LALGFQLGIGLILAATNSSQYSNIARHRNYKSIVPQHQRENQTENVAICDSSCSA
jgi:hypothetical protein